MSIFGRSLADGDRLEVAGATVRLKVHARARRISLRLDRTKREIIATAPSQRRLPEAAAFARDRASWIAERLAELPQEWVLSLGVINGRNIWRADLSAKFDELAPLVR